MPVPWMYTWVTTDPGSPDLGRLSQAGTPISFGIHYWSIAEIMACFDGLPGPVRRALADAAHPWAPHWADTVLWRGWSIDDVVERLRRADEQEARKREKQLRRGTY